MLPAGGTAQKGGLSSRRCRAADGRGMRALLLSILSLAACGGEPARDPGPAPADGHEAAVRAVVDRVLGERYELDGAPAYRFAAPAKGRVARWLFEPHEDGKSHSFGYVHGWCVDFQVTPSYVGYPPQPEAARMAFFVDGTLRGVFGPSRNSAPLELDRWYAVWVDPAFVVPAKPPAGR